MNYHKYLCIVTLLLTPPFDPPFGITNGRASQLKCVRVEIKETHAKALFFLFRLSFLIEFLCSFRFAAAAGLMATWNELQHWQEAQSTDCRNLRTCMTLAV